MYQKLGDLKQQKFVVSLFWKLKAQYQAVGSSMLL